MSAALTTASLLMRRTPEAQYLLRIADTGLIHAQRLAEWCGHGPALEEDIALTNMALDLLGQARALLAHVGRLQGQGGGTALSEDQLAFLRDERDYFNLTLAELPMRHSSAHAPGGDFADTVLRNFLLSAWFGALWAGLQQSSDADVAAIAGKAIKESRYHQAHAAAWVIRLGDGTDESARRMAAAMSRAWPYTTEMFERDAIDEEAQSAGLAPARDTLRPAWQAVVGPVLAQAGLQPPPDTPFRSHGSSGRHSEHMGYILAEMQSLQRQFPGGQW